MSSNIFYWIGGVAYLAVGVVCAVTFASDRYTENDDARESIRSLQRSQSRLDRKAAGELLFLVVVFWPIWFPIYWFGGSEEKETAEALEEFRRNHPEASLPADPEKEANQSSQPTRPTGG